MEAARNLRLVSETDQAPVLPWPETGEALTVEQTLRKLRELLDERDGLLRLTARQAAQNARLERRLAAEHDPDASSSALARTVVERWHARHPRAVITPDRIKLVRARLSDGYAADSEEWLPDHPTLFLAVDGVAAHPFLRFGKREREGSPSNRYDDLKDAIGDAAKVEANARAGYVARRDGWTPEGGWPDG